MSYFSTPTKQSKSTYSPQSCLKQQDMNGSFQKSHKPSSSQVRFSLPVEERSSDIDTTTDNDEENYPNSHFGHKKDPHFLDSDGSHTRMSCSRSESPSKIVYPASLNMHEEMPTFVDYSRKVNVPVPKEIWNHHNEYQSISTMDLSGSIHATPDGSPRKSHSRNNSIQSIIVETIETYNPRSGNNCTLDFQERPILLPNENTASELYIRSDSPMNKYEVPIPLQIHLPPYLSPDNKNKRRNSLVFDGDGYSVYLGDSASDASSSSDTQDYLQNYVEESDISIPSADNNLSFNVSDDDIDAKLGIDEDANVDLKKQVRNLKKSSAHYSKPALNKTLPEIEIQKPEAKLVKNNALEILATPTKEITIPAIEDIPRPTTKNGTLAFFNSFTESNEQISSKNSECPAKNEPNVNFKFPSNSEVPNNDNNFLKTPADSSNADIEKRRQMLRQNMGPRSHAHRRSRSIHNGTDMFVTMSPINDIHTREESSPPAPKIPQRSPLRPSSMLRLRTDDPGSETATVTINSRSKTLSIDETPGDKSVEEVYDISSVYSSEDGQQFSFMNSAEALPKVTVVDQSQDDEIPSKAVPTAIIVEKNAEQGRINSGSPIPPKPLSTIHSFGNNIETSLEIPTSRIMAEALKDISRNRSLLDPATRLSNNTKTNSQSSYESELSHRSYSSIATTVTETALTETTSKKSDPYKLPNIWQAKSSNVPEIRAPCYSNDKLRASDSKKLQDFHSHYNLDKNYTILENHGGKMVEVIVLDAPEDDAKNHSLSFTSPRSQRKSAEIVDLCEQTAEELKDLILELTSNNNKEPGTISKSKSLPPLPRHLLNGQKNALRHNKMSPEKQRRYMERIQGIQH
ncbi:Fir1 [Kluyveromyces lactis]|nr:Fir1 [Kluyveromyces lactis]